MLTGTIFWGKMDAVRDRSHTQSAALLEHRKKWFVELISREARRPHGEFFAWNNSRHRVLSPVITAGRQQSADVPVTLNVTSANTRRPSREAPSIIIGSGRCERSCWCPVPLRSTGPPRQGILRRHTAVMIRFISKDCKLRRIRAGEGLETATSSFGNTFHAERAAAERPREFGVDDRPAMSAAAPTAASVGLPIKVFPWSGPRPLEQRRTSRGRQSHRRSRETPGATDCDEGPARLLISYRRN
jgi:hypothetical protein